MAMSVYREGDVECRKLLGLRTDLEIPMRLINRVDDADDVLELGLVVRVQDGLVELAVRRVGVLALGLPLALDLLGEVREAHDLNGAFLGDHVLAGHVDRVDGRAPLLPYEDEL